MWPSPTTCLLAWGKIGHNKCTNIISGGARIAHDSSLLTVTILTTAKAVTCCICSKILGRNSRNTRTMLLGVYNQPVVINRNKLTARRK